jgi:hypothetical protein
MKSRVLVQAIVLLGLAACEQTTSIQPFTADTTISVNWLEPNGVTSKAQHYGVNLYKIFEPVHAVKNEYVDSVKAMKPGIVRVHRYDMVLDSSASTAGWVIDANKSTYHWDKSRIQTALSRIKEIGGERMMNISNFPNFLTQSGSLRLETNNLNAYAKFCADLVQIVNKDLGLDFKYWEVGNELDDSAQKYDNDMGKYAQIVNAAATAMKAVDSSIKVGGGAIAQSYADNARDEKAFLAELSSNVDFFSFHTYSTGDGNLALNQLWDKAQAGIAEINRLEKNLVASQKPGLEVFHNEYNISWAPPDTRMNNEIGAVFDALAMRSLALSGNTGGMAWNESDGWYGKNDGEWGNFKRRPSSFVYELFNTHLVGSGVKSASSNESIVVAFAVSSGNKRAVALINRAVSSGAPTKANVKLELSAAGLNWTRFQVDSSGLTSSSISASTLGSALELPAASITVLVGNP